MNINNLSNRSNLYFQFRFILATKLSCQNVERILIKQMVDALVAKADEGRGRLRKALGSCQQTMIQRCPNEETPLIEISRMLNVS